MASGGSFPGQPSAPSWPPPGQQPGTVVPGGPGPQSPRPQSRRPRSFPAWAVLPFAGGAVVVLGIFFILQFTVFGSSGGGSGQPAGQQSALAAPTGPMPA